MSEGKGYITQVQSGGTVHISEETICSVAAMAAVEVQGVAGLSHLGRDLSAPGRKNLSRALRVRTEEDALILDLSLVVGSGFTVTDVAKNVQAAVQTAVEGVTGLRVSAVNIHVSGIVPED